MFVPHADGTFTSRRVKRIAVAATTPGERLVRGRALPLKSWNAVEWHERRKAGWPALRAAYAGLSQR